VNNWADPTIFPHQIVENRINTAQYNNNLDLEVAIQQFEATQLDPRQDVTEPPHPSRL